MILIGRDSCGNTKNDCENRGWHATVTCTFGLLIIANNILYNGLSELVTQYTDTE